eukprot:jgi/Botrbrau1/6949/Bobra.0215s0026.1
MAFGPRWSLGLALTAMALADAEDAGERIRGFLRDCGTWLVPCSAFHFGSGYTSIAGKRYVFHWNRSKFPDPEGLVREFREAGLPMVANLKPCLLLDHPRYQEAATAGLFVYDQDTRSPCISQFWDGEGAHLDFTNPDTIAWWQEGVKECLLDKGIAGAWNDNNEYEIADELATCKGFGQEARLQVCKPVQALLMTRASWEVTAVERPGQRVMTVSRAGLPGIQRYGQTWSGDNFTSWESLRWNLRTGLQMSLSGMFNVGHDVGGFAGPVPEPELLVRWVQTGILHPRFIFNSWKADQTVTTPWMHPSVAPYTIWAIRLRYRLLPYLYSLYWQAAVQHIPIIRPTFFDFGEDPTTWQENQEVLLGPFLLAAPVLYPSARHRQVYLPKGPSAWYDFHSLEPFKAGETIHVAAPLNRLPLLAPAGSIVPMTDCCDPNDFARSHDEPSRNVRLFPGDGDLETSFELYEDDGVSTAYHTLQGRCHLTFRLVSTPTQLHLSLTRRGGYALPYSTITVALPPAEMRPLQLTAPPEGPRLVQGRFRWHEL